jgi:hypothetical protein
MAASFLRGLFVDEAANHQDSNPHAIEKFAILLRSVPASGGQNLLG